jgi:outer membrane protein OmpA-like peptidoglycan-associated protein
MSVPVSTPLRRYRRRILGWGLFGVVVLCGVAAPLFIRSVERDLERRVPSELAERGFEGVSAAFSGQDGVLRCATPLDEPEDAIDAAIDVWGVRAIELDRSCRVGGAPTEGTDGPATDLSTDPSAASPDDTVTGAPTSAPSATVAEVTPDLGSIAEVATSGPVADVVSSTVELAPRPTASSDDAAALEDELNELVAANPIQFAPGSADVTSASLAVLDQLAGIAKQFDGVTITIEGHTDSDNAQTDNQTLSEERAENVIAALVARGVPAADLVSVGLGSSRPIVVGGVEDKDASRRIEFRVTTEDGA